MGASLARLRNDGTGVNPVLNGALIRCGRDRSRVRRPGRRTNRSPCQATIFRKAPGPDFPHCIGKCLGFGRPFVVL